MPDDRSARLVAERARRLVAEGRLREARALLDTCMTVRADVVYYRAWLADRLGDDDTAVRLYRHALRLDAEAAGMPLTLEEHLGSHLGLALVLFRQGEREHARDVVRGAEISNAASPEVAAVRLLVGDDV